MALDQITAAAITSTARLAIAAFIFWIYYKNRHELAFWFGIFFLLFGIHGIFRILSIISGEAVWYFAHRVFVTFGTIAILQGLASIGITWIRKYMVVPIVSVIAILLAYNEAFILGRAVAEQAGSLATLPTLSIGGIGLIIAGYYFCSFRGKLPLLGICLLAAGFILLGLLHFAFVWMAPAGLAGLAFYLGLAFTAMIGFGWWISMSKG